MPKHIILLVTLVVILVTSYLTLAINTDFSKLISKSEIETAINQANHLYKQEKEKGKDFENGPCLSDALLPNWVVDIVHNPRTALDNLPQNQCPAFLEGKAQHFVELDTDGKLIRAQ
jgi:hypothetical protein